tara:strand:+ start:528 stop:731 length:204 start_codon:yes stop_codon:yes gene_type:complete
MRRINVNMQDSCHQALSVFAAYQQKSINAVVLEALSTHIRNHPSYVIIAKDLLQKTDELGGPLNTKC